ncbi:MAG: hypothetical protein EXR76_11860 [Myxococcales bacterium]|nr:hypothetical protein [Myxococcales bacterium]
MDHEREHAAALARANIEVAQTHARLLEEQAHLAQAEKLSSIGLLAGGVAHEVNNPLSGVIACVKSLRDESILEDRRDACFETVLEGLERIRLTVRGLLDFSRKPPDSTVDLDVFEAAEAAMRLVQSAALERGVTLELEANLNGTRCQGSRGQIIQVLVNLILNAVEASPKGATVRVSGSSQVKGTTLTVSDRGAGIASEVLGRVFGPFFTTKPDGQGTGLGLSVSLGIARAQGGDLKIVSTQGEGTVVQFLVPREGNNGRSAVR